MGSPSRSQPRIQEPQKFFIIYKSDSAKDLAEHIHDSLHERGVDVFLDIKDLKVGLSQKEWRKQRDKAIEDAQVFIFIVTDSSSTSKEIRHELKKAKDLGKDIKVFIDESIWNNKVQTRIRLGRRFVNLKDFQVDRFHTDSKEELLRKVTSSIPIAEIIRAK